LGWKKRGDLDPTFEEKAFELETSTLANPKYVEVKTGFGYHIIMVEGRKWFNMLREGFRRDCEMEKVEESGAGFSHIHNTLMWLWMNANAEALIDAHMPTRLSAWYAS
jgi:hypothetical protein